MDRTHQGYHSRMKTVSTSGAFANERSDRDMRSSQQPRVTSNGGLRVTTSAEPRESPALESPEMKSNSFANEGPKQRKGSLRNAVRRIFGKKRESETPSSWQSQPRHSHHKSEPSALTTQHEVPEHNRNHEEQEQARVERQHEPPTMFSPPLDVMTSPSFPRTRSPYAVEFPQSARLKPINLSAPFSAPGSQLRRRKTLPSLVLADSNASVKSAQEDPSDAPPIPSFESTREEPGDIGVAVTTMRSEKRKSRSADDLRSAQKSRPISSRKRSDEMRYWRDSFHGSVRYASGLRMPPSRGSAVIPEGEGEKTPTAETMHLFDSGIGSNTTNQHSRQISSVDEQPPEGEEDIEDRVARLESGLKHFQGALSAMQAGRNRHTVLIGGPAPGRSSSEGRTASMLVETLKFEPSSSSEREESPPSSRPSTSPEPPRTPARNTCPTHPRLPHTARDPTTDDPFVTTSKFPIGIETPASHHPKPPSRQTQPGELPQHTFRSLYEMLADERSARRRLETDMRNLRAQVAALHDRVDSNPRASSHLGSARLHALLRDTESTPPGSRAQHAEQLNGHRRNDSSTTARASAEGEQRRGSETSGDDEVQTPYNAYQTPREEYGRFPFSDGGHGGLRRSREDML